MKELPNNVIRNCNEKKLLNLKRIVLDYIKEFNKYVKLNEYDLKYMSYIYLIQLLSSTYGYKEYINNNENIELLEFAYFRTNICKYLFNNAENISNILLKSIKI